jgi:hypothetical protein
MTAFDLMLIQMQGLPLPALPKVIGRVHRAQEDGDEDLLEVPTVGELAATLGITRQGAHLRLRQFHATGDRARLLAPKDTNRGRARHDRC